MDSSASAGRVASAVLDPRRWQGLALLTTASMNSARVFLAAWSRSQTRTVVPVRALYLHQATSVSGEEVPAMTIAQCPVDARATRRSQRWWPPLSDISMADGQARCLARRRVIDGPAAAGDGRNLRRLAAVAVPGSSRG